MYDTNDLRILIKKLSTCITKSPDSPESRLMFAILSTAIMDLKDRKIYKKRHKKTKDRNAVIVIAQSSEFRSACNYLSQDNIDHAELIGIDSDYIRRLLSSMNISLETAPVIVEEIREVQARVV